MRVLIDVGNTRLKYRINSEQKTKSVPYSSGLESAIKKINKDMGGEISEICVSSVKSKEFNSELSGLLKSHLRIAPVFAVTHKVQGGVTCVYEDEKRLGVDRWLAVLAGFKSAQGNVCIIDCGTATTVDVVQENGMHLGGFIIPGKINPKTQGAKPIINMSINR